MNTLTHFGIGLFGAIVMAEGAIAHGVTIQTQLSPRVEVQALYEDGKPIIKAQVQIFSPSKPEQPQFSGQTDSQGRYGFTPTESGLWEVLVRQSGHGESLTLPVDLGDLQSHQFPSPEGTNLPQRIIMVGSVIWGCVGTALYFKGRSA